MYTFFLSFRHIALLYNTAWLQQCIFPWSSTSPTSSANFRLSTINDMQGNHKSGFAQNMQRLQSIPPHANSEDVVRCKNVISFRLKGMRDECQRLLDSLTDKTKSCYLPSMDLLPAGRSRLQYIEYKLHVLSPLVPWESKDSKRERSVHRFWDPQCPFIRRSSILSHESRHSVGSKACASLMHWSAELKKITIHRASETRSLLSHSRVKKAKKAFSLKTISDHFRQVKSGEDRNKGSEKAMSKVHSTEIGNRTMKKVKVA